MKTSAAAKLLKILAPEIVFRTTPIYADKLQSAPKVLPASGLNFASPSVDYRERFG
jgi:hypothetical protein